MLNGNQRPWKVLTADALAALNGRDGVDPIVPANTFRTAIVEPTSFRARDYGVCECGGKNDRCPLCAGSSRLPFHGFQIGMEATVSEYVAHIIDMVRGVHRALTDDGVLWLVANDCRVKGDERFQDVRPEEYEHMMAGDVTGTRRGDPDLMDRSILATHHQLAMELMRLGLFCIRSEVTFYITDNLSNRVFDRPNDATKTVFMLTKKGRGFSYNEDEAREPALYTESGNLEEVRSGPAARHPRYRTHLRWKVRDDGTRAIRNMWETQTGKYRGAEDWESDVSRHIVKLHWDAVAQMLKCTARRGDMILDPMCGSGTVGAVARRLGMGFLGIDLVPEHAQLARSRIFKSINDNLLTRMQDATAVARGMQV